MDGALDFSAKVALMGRLLETVREKSVTEPQVKRFISDCEKIAGIRNAIAHGSWVDGGMRHVSRRTLKAVIKYTAPGELDKHSNFVREVSQAGLSLYVLYVPEDSTLAAVAAKRLDETNWETGSERHPGFGS